MTTGGRSRWRRAGRRVAMFALSLLIIAALWEGYKAIGPEQGGSVFGWRIIPKTNDRVMPHTWTMLAGFGEPASGARDGNVASEMLGYAWFTLRLSLVGLVLGVAGGIALAVVMARFKIVERGLLPYVVASQTIPLIALAPQVAAIGGNYDLPKWTWASALAAFLAFFPVAVSTLRGLQAAPAESLELMDSYAAGWWKTLAKVRFPAAVPYMMPGLKLAATASVIGVVVSEISLGGLHGVGYATLNYSQKTTAQPAAVYASVFTAAALGLLVFGLIVATESWMMRDRQPEQAS